MVTTAERSRGVSVRLLQPQRGNEGRLELLVAVGEWRSGRGQALAPGVCCLQCQLRGTPPPKALPPGRGSLTHTKNNGFNEDSSVGLQMAAFRK